MSWHKWKNVKKVVNGKECSAFERLSYSGTLEELLQTYCNDCRDMPLHLLNMEWQRNMYCVNRDVLKKGDVQLVIDYAKNYSHVSQDEPQSAHWDRRQSTLHPIAVSFPCPEENCDELVTDEVVCISPDLKHDIYGVELFIDKTIELLKNQQVQVDHLFEWSDNCVGQYKSRFAFELISKSEIPRMRSFYGENHGKSAADGIIGRLKMKLYSNVKVGAIIESPQTLFNFCQENFATKNVQGCQHFRQHYLYFPVIERPKKQPEVPSVKNILKQHCIRTTGKKGVIEIRELTCMCFGCQKGDSCIHDQIVMPWVKVFFQKTSKQNNNLHWKQCVRKPNKEEKKVKLEKDLEKPIMHNIRP